MSTKHHRSEDNILFVVKIAFSSILGRLRHKVSPKTITRSVVIDVVDIKGKLLSPQI